MITLNSLKRLAKEDVKTNVWKNIPIDDYKNCRSGIRLVSQTSIDRDLNNAIKEMLKWLRKNYVFPIRCPIYLFDCPYLISRKGKQVSASFIAPYDRFEEPYIKVAVGDYNEEKKTRGRDNAIASILVSIFHEVTHYYQWIHDILDDKPQANERQAVYYANKRLQEYAATREHP
ncbi:MAG: hypothetical protein J6D23_03525 [Clostridia bacterium]|nr:hypothetical protein [Clostridia bacterium]